MYGFFKLPISDKKMTKVMYAILRTQSKLVNSSNHSINDYTRKQSIGFLVDVVIEIDADKIKLFEELTEIKLQTSKSRNFNLLPFVSFYWGDKSIFCISIGWLMFCAQIQLK